MSRSCRRTAARCASISRMRARRACRARACASCSRASERLGFVESCDLRRRSTSRCRRTKRKLLAFLIEAKDEGKTICGYGAPGKGNTLLNYCGIGTDFLDFTVDRNPYKHGRFTPGTHIPILPVEAIDEAKPDYVLILPWNLKDEIVRADAPHRRLGRQVRRADSRSHGHRSQGVRS